MMLGWIGNPNHSEWIKLNSAIDARLGRKPGATPSPTPPIAVSPAPADRSSQTGAPGGWLDRAKAFVAGASGGQAPVAAAAPAGTETRPAWASDVGRDKFGRWAEFALGGARQRMRVPNRVIVMAGLDPAIQGQQCEGGILSIS
jgi:hypothetical protein